MFNVAILGASGFVGGELLRLLSAHPRLHVARAFSTSRPGARIADAHPHVGSAYGCLAFEPFTDRAVSEVDLLFAALPHGESQRIAADVVRLGVAMVDLGADFRLGSAASYARWYGEPHAAPELVGSFTYGVPELHRQSIATSKLVAAAGCYATAAILALKPLVAGGLIDPDTIIVDAASGVSGAGRALKDSSHFNSAAESFTAYGLLTHRHTAEMEEQLGARVLFTPHLAPMNRGILATCYASATGPMAGRAPLEALADAYAAEPFIHVSEAVPATKWALGSNSVHLTARFDARTGRVLAIAALDNLVKGAAGQMIQCANLMMGLDETAGLPSCGIHP